MALLEADVHYDVARVFIARVKEKSLGEAVLQSVTPGQQIVKIFHDELTALLGGDAAGLSHVRPLHIMLVGLNGAGKTTSAAKLAKWLKSQGRQPRLIACDLFRPAAVTQLVSLGEQIGVPVFRPDPAEKNPVEAARAGLAWCEKGGGDVFIFDTAGRQDLDEELVAELGRTREVVAPHETLLVCDAATGQQAVGVAETFHAQLGLTGIILTKLDGDARGGAALSIREITRQPIKFSGTGEKLDQFEVFDPSRLAGRILGMGDVVTLVEKAAQAVSEQDALDFEKKLRTASFNFEDFLHQFRLIKRMGPLENLLSLLPGMNPSIASSFDDAHFKRIEAIILSMTPAERAKPDILNARRRQRIARGSGTSVTEVNNLLNKFHQMRTMMKKVGSLQKFVGLALGGNVSKR